MEDQTLGFSKKWSTSGCPIAQKTGLPPWLVGEIASDQIGLEKMMPKFFFAIPEF